MIIRNKTAGMSLVAIVAAGIFSTACASGTAEADQAAAAPAAGQEVIEKQLVEKKHAIEKRIVKEHTTDDGKVIKTEKVIIVDGDDFDGDVDFEFRGDDGTHKVIRIERTGDHAMHMSDCVSDDDTPPVKFEWKDESEDGTRVDVSVICLTGEDAEPENQVVALEKAIARMEAEGAAEQQRRTRAIEALRSKLETLKAEAE